MKMQLNHFSVRTTQLDATRHFYEQVLGLNVGPRPAFPFPGLWMYHGPHDDVANAVVHIIGLDPHDPDGLKAYLGDRDPASLQGTGAVDHIAFFTEGLQKMLEHLSKLGVTARQRTVPSIGLHQLFLDDPNGVVIELNYPEAEARALGGACAGTAA